jgi:tetratricopeptide (TPR) repeat protein
MTGHVGTVFQVGSISGDVHLHETPRRAPAARPVMEWSALDLDVHRAITVGAGPLPDLPAYLRREHDRLLRDHLSELSRGVMVVLTGGSSTGKTRALFEAVRGHEELSTWRLVYPRTAVDLLHVLVDGVAPGTVLWLNETQNHLSGAPGEQAAAALRALLENTRRVVVLGTLWPEYWSRFTDAQESSHVRFLLQQRVARIRVAERFSPAEVAEVRARGSVDPRLAGAVATSGDGRKVIQTMAGGPALVERYEHPDSVDERYARAIISAAMDARRLGHRGLLPAALLADAAVGYLDAEDRVGADSWFERGMTVAAGRDRHGITALIPTRLSQDVGPAEGYELHDYLDQHGRKARRAAHVPDSAWQAAIRHVGDQEDLLRLARSAFDRLLYRYADPLCEKADPSGTQLLDVFVAHGRFDAAAAALAQMRNIAVPKVIYGELGSVMTGLLLRGRLDEHRAFLQLFVDEGRDLRWMGPHLAKRMVGLGLLDDAEAVLRQLLARGRLDVQEQLADLLVEKGDWDAALELVRRSDRKWTSRWMADQLARTGNHDGLRRLAATGCPQAACRLLEVQLVKGDLAGALAGLAEFRSMNRPPNLRLLELLVDHGQIEQAQECVISSRPLSERLISDFVGVLVARGHRSDAIAFLTSSSADLSDVLGDRVYELLADQYAADGHWEHALALASRSAGRWARPWLAKQFAKAGNVAKLRELAEVDVQVVRQELVDLLVRRGEIDDALELLRGYVDGNESWADGELARLLAEHGRLAELRERTAAGDRECAWWLLALAQRDVPETSGALPQHTGDP